MKLCISCDCGDAIIIDSTRQDIHERFEPIVSEWKREHVRSHEKDGDYDEHAFSIEVLPRGIKGL